jgi:hypothetical protein
MKKGLRKDKFSRYLYTHEYAYFIFHSLVWTFLIWFCCSISSIWIEEGSWWGVREFLEMWGLGFLISFYFHWRMKKLLNKEEGIDNEKKK